MARLTTFIIMLVVFMMVFVGALGSLMTELNDNYNVIGYNKTKIDAYDKLSEISEHTNQTKEKAITLQSKSGILDVLGGFFESAYEAVKISASSFDLFSTMSDQAIDDSGIANAEIYKKGIITIVIIIIFLGIIVGAAIKKQL